MQGYTYEQANYLFKPATERKCATEDSVDLSHQISLRTSWPAACSGQCKGREMGGDVALLGHVWGPLTFHSFSFSMTSGSTHRDQVTVT